jgi:hypothetical protein
VGRPSKKEKFHFGVKIIIVIVLSPQIYRHLLSESLRLCLFISNCSKEGVPGIVVLVLHMQK